MPNQPHQKHILTVTRRMKFGIKTAKVACFHAEQRLVGTEYGSPGNRLCSPVLKSGEL